MKRFPAKILLFGEYSIITGSRGLAVPFDRYGGLLSFPGAEKNSIPNEAASASNRQLGELAGYLAGKNGELPAFSLDAFRKDLSNGLYFQSDIPNQYGVGSSGALTAALYERYGNAKSRSLSLPEIRREMAVIESFYHGTSSGLDPLVALMQKPVWIDSSEQIGVKGWPEEFPEECSVFLLDSGQPGGTGDLVNWFLEQYKRSGFRKVFERELVGNVNRLLEGLLGERPIELFPLLQRISRFQLNRLRPMIPMAFRRHFRYGLETGDFILKLCGSGGGGYLLGFTKNRAVAESYFREREINSFFIEVATERVDGNGF